VQVLGYAHDLVPGVRPDALWKSAAAEPLRYPAARTALCSCRSDCALRVR